MAETEVLTQLSRELRTDLGRFLRRPSRDAEPVRALLKTLAELEWPAAVFGGTIRSLHFSRLFRPTRPRDIDIVLANVSVQDMRRWLVRGSIELVRETRFGGFQLRSGSWFFDVWPLHETFLILQDRVKSASFDYLPKTTFLNVEAIAAEAWTKPGKERTVYCGDGQFFRAMINRVVEINRPENPFPALCVVRSMIITRNLGFQMGPRLAQYIAEHGSTLSESELGEVQEKHYRSIEWDPADMLQWIRHIDRAITHEPTDVLSRPFGDRQSGSESLQNAEV